MICYLIANILESGSVFLFTATCAIILDYSKSTQKTLFPFHSHALNRLRENVPSHNEDIAKPLSSKMPSSLFPKLVQKLQLPECFSLIKTSIQPHPLVYFSGADFVINYYNHAFFQIPWIPIFLHTAVHLS